MDQMTELAIRLALIESAIQVLATTTQQRDAVLTTLQLVRAETCGPSAETGNAFRLIGLLQQTP